MLTILFHPEVIWAPFFGFMIHFHVNAQSFMVQGLPSAHLRPGRMRRVYVKPSAEIPPFFSVGTSASSAGSSSPLMLTRSIGSNMGNNSIVAKEIGPPVRSQLRLLAS